MHYEFLLAALKQAWFGRGLCAPNPSVGAIAVYRGEIIARAWHRGAGTPHAEQLVLEQLPPGLKGITLYVTLEPCNHWGRTSPCVDALIAYGVSQVIFGFYDPNPLVAKNNTPERLKAAGIVCIYHPLKEIADFYASYQYWTQTQRPWVTVKLAHSLNAKISDHLGEPCQISNAACAQFTHEQRWYSDIILTTARTIMADNPRLNARHHDVLRAKPLAILDRRCQLSGQERVFTEAARGIIYFDVTFAAPMPIQDPRFSHQPIATEAGALKLEAILEDLGKQGYHDVWVEAGGKLFAELHRLGLVQRTYLYIAPLLLSAEGTEAYPLASSIFKKKYHLSWQLKGDNVVACLDWEKHSQSIGLVDSTTLSEEALCLQD